MEQIAKLSENFKFLSSEYKHTDQLFLGISTLPNSCPRIRELEYAHSFQGTERKALKVQTLPNSEQWAVSYAGRSFSDEVGGNPGREELVSPKCRTRQNLVDHIDSTNRHLQMPILSHVLYWVAQD